MTRRPAARAALAALALACAALLTACGPTSGKADSGGGADDAQVQQMQQKVDAADSAAAQADTNAGQDN
ncbi:hypothetical protein Kpho02_02250 [Kitasatospora phosalacinea]|uniref:Uncharacterized protein n=1 Tax=Kitasatospora phosalacinea TaxID=2065 RepID=A0A9W6Q3N6_9ACTN|nr:hypothetical protein [Kitasatospora phosalacinea]GLW67926.1 hypothetical protein Kpho02_02250 [Kitasatospora phosalacinea]